MELFVPVKREQFFSFFFLFSVQFQKREGNGRGRPAADHYLKARGASSVI